MTTETFDIKAAKRYLETGGLGEVVGLTELSMSQGFRKVQSDTDMAMALCLLAAEGLQAREIISDLIGRIDDDLNYVPDSEALQRGRDFLAARSKRSWTT